MKIKNGEETGASEMNMFSEEVKSIFENEEIKKEERNALFTLDSDENVVDIATPYKVRNLTGVTIFIEPLFEDKKEKYILNDGQTTKIAISYEKQTRKNFEGINSKINDNIKVQFQGLYLPIQKISLNKIGKNVHSLTESEDEAKQIYYETKVIDMNKVLTLRTQNLLINSTQFSYIIHIKNPLEPHSSQTHTLHPSEWISFPSSLSNCKISLKTLDDSEFSNYIPAKKLIFNTAVDHTNYIRSGTTFTMVRKERNDTLKDWFDVHLIPPIRIRNGLPVMIQLAVVGQNIQFLQEKAEEKHISFYSPDEVIQLVIKIDGYEKEPVPIKFLKKSYEKSIQLQSTEYKNSTLNLYANFSDEKAGWYITFYVKTWFINAWSMPLNIYNSSTNTKGTYIPFVNSWKNLVLAPDITFWYFTLDKESSSEEINVEGGSLTGQVSLMKKSTKEMAELVYTTSLSLVDVNQSLYTKVITIVPKYVIINKTDEKLLITQEKLDDDFTIIDSHSRENFKWLNGTNIKKVMIKILDSKANDPINEWMWSSPFVLDEVGSQSVRTANRENKDTFMYWKIDRQIINDIIFISIDKEEEKHPLYQICNNALDIILKYRQKKSEHWEFCDTYETNRFAWDDLYKPHKLEVEAWLKGRKNKRLCQVEVELDVMEKTDEFRYDVREFLEERELHEGNFDSYKRVLKYSTHTNGYTKICTFDDSYLTAEEEKDAEDHTPELMVNVELGGMGISLI